jgi:hypothetical protein
MMNAIIRQKDKIMKYTAYCRNKTDYAACLENSVLFAVVQK